MNRVRLGIVGLGSFGRNHLRVLRELPDAEVVAVADIDPSRLSDAECLAVPSHRDLAGRVDAAIVAVPTTWHADVGCELLEAGIDVLVEKPIAPDLASAQRLIETAARNGRVLQVGHLERFNPAVQAVRPVTTLPLFFEIHRMSVFTPRSLDVDVVLDLMIHDIDILLSLTGTTPDEIRAAGIRILSQNVDIANVRLAFANGCVANLTASRVSVEKIRKLRLFQPGEYISLDYSRQDATRIRVSGAEVAFDSLPVEKDEPLKLELASFLRSVRTRQEPEVTGTEAARALEVCLDIIGKIEEHGELVQNTIAAFEATSKPSLSS